MKKLFIILGAITVSLSACLKDKPNVDFSKIGTFVEMPYSGLPNFSKDAMTAPDDTIVQAFTANIDSDYPLKTDTKVTVAVDNSIIAKYIASSGTTTNYLPMPDGSYKLSAATVTIPAGSRLGNYSITFYKNQLDPTKSYMLPIKIASADQPISGNFAIHYFHFIGNDFAGAYIHDFIRTPHGGDFTGKPETFFPDSPTQFEVAGGYYNQTMRYVVSWTQTGLAPNTVYSKFVIAMNSDDLAAVATVPIAQSTPPSITGYDDTKTYTYAQVLALFKAGLTWGANGTRINLDQYYKP